MTPFDSFHLNFFPFDSPYVFEYPAVTYPLVGVRNFNNVHDCFKPSITLRDKTGIKNLRIWKEFGLN